MNIMNRIRLYHATLAILAILAYFTGELGIIHAWLGYGVTATIFLRLIWALGGERQLGLMRFYPSFKGLKMDNIFTHPIISKTLMLGIAISLIVVTFTGITMDKGKAIGLANVQILSTAHGNHDREEEGPTKDIHELFANLLLLLVGMHVTYLLLFKRPLSNFMMFIPKAEIENEAITKK